MCVGEVERGVQHEVGLDDPASLLADVVEEPGALQRDAALIAVLGKEKGREGQCHTPAGREGMGEEEEGRRCTLRALRTVAPSNLSFGVWGEVLPL